VSSQLAVERTIALLLVTCPCVLALATPIIFSVGLIRAARRGILFRSTEVIERLEHVKELIFDKTGTLTTGVMSVREAWCVQEGNVEVVAAGAATEHLAVLAELEKGIEHPVAHALLNFTRLAGVSSTVIMQRECISGRGVSARSEQGDLLMIGSPEWELLKQRIAPAAERIIHRESSSGATLIVYSPKPEVVYLFALSDMLRAESKTVLGYFNKRSMQLSVLSGDLHASTVAIAQQLEIPAAHCFAPYSPEEKSKFVQTHEQQSRCAMIGDGINDIGALKAAHVGIGIIGGAEASLKVADVYLADAGIEKLPLLFTGAQRVMRAVRLALCVSVSYNIVAAIAACTGMIGPLEAAIIMPLSSLTSISFAATRRSF
jgi:Cu2+-exporting ATPase